MKITDLISRSAVLEMINRTKAAAMTDEAEFNKSQRNAIRAIADLFSAVVKDIPAIDAVPVVRCKDCKHWGTDWVLSETEHVKCCNLAKYMVGANGYCIYGEKREEDADETD